MNESTQILSWAEEYLTTYKNLKIINNQIISQRSYSTVYKIQTDQEVFYLKKTPKDLFLEPAVISFLNTQHCGHIPKMIAKNDELNCFLMTSCGDETLRHLFKGKVDLNRLRQGINNFTEIQRALENNVLEMLSFGIPDWRLNKFPLLYCQLIQQEQLLLDDGMRKQEIEKLHQLERVCKDLCNKLLNFGLAETINHNDFHENNMILNKAIGNVSIIDWGEVVITHPFFSLCCFLWNITYFQNMETDDPQYKALQLFCIESWMDSYTQDQLLEILNLTNRLSGVYAALGYEKIYKATHNQANNVQKENPGSIAGCLRTFLGSVTTN